MNIQNNIRQLYKTIQPTVKQSVENVSYYELLPELKLQPYIYCYWELKTNEKLKENFFYKVVADGCIDIFFELKNPKKSYVMGFCKNYVEFPLGKSFHYIGIRFLPTNFPQIFNIDASELSNRTEKLSLIDSETAFFIAENFNEKIKKEEIKVVLDNYLLELISKVKFNNDERFFKAIDIILKKFGVLNIETELETGISSRQLRRLFEFYIGDTAKTFSKVVRFQNILRAKPSTQSLRNNKLFFDVGYYDQAHFIKEFKNFYGVTPSKAFNR